MVRVCFVCLGNICRSPTAEGIFRKLVAEAGLAAEFEIDSAGTAAWHVGNRADPRTRAEASRRGVTLTSRARRFSGEDFDRFDHVLAMDRENLVDLQELARNRQDVARLSRLRDWDPGGPGGDVPDPYHGGDGGFRLVFDVCERACRGLLAHLVSEHGLG